jgi:hypothetical protein
MVHWWVLVHCKHPFSLKFANGPFFFLFNLNKFIRSIYRFIYIDYLFVALDWTRVRCLRVEFEEARRGGRLSSFSRREAVVSLLLRFASNPRGFCDDDDRQLVQGGCGKK